MLRGMKFDPDAAATSDSGIYGLPTEVDEARFVIVPVPFDATTSYRDGTRNGPEAVVEASRQVDLYDIEFGRPYEQGIAALPATHDFVRNIARLNREARKFAEPVIEAAGVVEGKPKLKKALQEVNRRGEEVNDRVDTLFRELLREGRTPVVLGGDHSTPFGAIRAYGATNPGLGILHIDAHADLRDAYEGFAWSHASIMNNVVRRIGAKGGIATLVQVGIRDFGEREYEMIKEPRPRGESAITTFFDAPLKARLHAGEKWAAICDEIVGNLPKKIYISFDIDGLDPVLCPDTGTPVPGGLSFNEMLELLRAVGRGGRRIVGFDLNEVAPSPLTPRADWGGDWNANVGARVLYKMIGAAALGGSPAAER
jgi:agmatinase